MQPSQTVAYKHGIHFRRQTQNRSLSQVLSKGTSGDVFNNEIESCLKIISKNCRTQIRNKTDSFILTFKNIVLSSAGSALLVKATLGSSHRIRPQCPHCHLLLRVPCSSKGQMCTVLLVISTVYSDFSMKQKN